jgi:membrane associated rhomboid family serine protease
LRGIDLTQLLGLHFFLASDFQIYQFFTYMFLHGGFTHIFFNMFALWMFGSVIERVWGPKKFVFYYIVCGIGAGITQELVQYATYTIEGISAYQYVSAGGVQMTTDAYINLWTTIGASGAVYGILLAFGMIFPNERLFIIPFPFPIKAKWLIVGYIAIELFSAMTGPGDGVAHMAHLGGMLFGFLLIRYWQKHPDSSQGFGRSRGQEFFENMKRRYDQRQQQNNRMKAEQTDPRRESDEEYNARKRKNQEEVDAILDKIRKSGYDSLTKEEKKKLFDQSRES